MVYSYYMSDSGEWVKSKNFESVKEFKEYAVKHPRQTYVCSTSEPDLKGRSYSEHPKFNETR